MKNCPYFYVTIQKLKLTLTQCGTPQGTRLTQNAAAVFERAPGRPGGNARISQVRRGVEAMRPPGMTPQDSPNGEPATDPSAIQIDGIQSVLRASGEVPAARPDQRRKGVAVKIDRRLHCFLQVFFHSLMTASFPYAAHTAQGMTVRKQGVNHRELILPYFCRLGLGGALESSGAAASSCPTLTLRVVRSPPRRIIASTSSPIAACAM